MKIAGVQMDVSIGEVDANLNRIGDRLREAASQEAKLVVFPECAVTGYCFDSVDEARPFAQSIPGPATDRLVDLCRESDAPAIVGLLESDGDAIYNAAVCVGPSGLIGSYRKIHLPFLGVDRFTTHGDRPFAVDDVGNLRVGTNICYDSGFPESSRSLTLQGADLIALPTNWPPGATCFADYAINTRAMENGVYYIAVNRVGTERGVTFIGMSRICSPSGETIASADGTSETILYADIDPEKARSKRVIREPGVHAIDRIADRRPEMYGALLEPHSLPRPGRDIPV